MTYTLQSLLFQVTFRAKVVLCWRSVKLGMHRINSLKLFCHQRFYTYGNTTYSCPFQSVLYWIACSSFCPRPCSTADSWKCSISTTWRGSCRDVSIRRLHPAWLLFLSQSVLPSALPPIVWKRTWVSPRKWWQQCRAGGRSVHSCISSLSETGLLAILTARHLPRACPGFTVPVRPETDSQMQNYNRMIRFWNISDYWCPVKLFDEFSLYKFTGLPVS